jgi:peptide/nickel transport system permease protein
VSASPRPCSSRFYALVIAVGLGVPAGIFAALNRNSLLDRLLMLLAMSGTAIAGFFLGIL